MISEAAGKKIVSFLFGFGIVGIAGAIFLLTQGLVYTAATLIVGVVIFYMLVYLVMSRKLRKP